MSRTYYAVYRFTSCTCVVCDAHTICHFQHGSRNKQPPNKRNNSRYLSMFIRLCICQIMAPPETIILCDIILKNTNSNIQCKEEICSNNYTVCIRGVRKKCMISL